MGSVMSRVFLEESLSVTVAVGFMKLDGSGDPAAEGFSVLILIVRVFAVPPLPRVFVRREPELERADNSVTPECSHTHRPSIQPFFDCIDIDLPSKFFKQHGSMYGRIEPLPAYKITGSRPAQRVQSAR